MESRVPIFDLNCLPEIELKPQIEFSFDLNREPDMDLSLENILVPELAKQTDTEAGKGRGKRPQSQVSVNPPRKRMRVYQFMDISNTILEPETQQKSFEVVQVGPNEAEIDESYSADLNKIPETIVEAKAARPPMEIRASIPQEAGIDEIDLPDLNDVVRSGVQYVKELYVFYDKQQHLFRPRDYMHLQRGISADMRACLVDWMIGMHGKLHLDPETLYLAVSIVDRFLSLSPVDGRQLFYVGISALLIASKYEEDWAPWLDQFIDIAGDDYTGAQVRHWEKKILNILEWYLTVPTVYMFLLRYVKAAKADQELERLIYYYGELGLKQYSLILYCPSLVAAATVYAARRALQKSPAWTDALQRHTSFRESQLLDCAEVILEAHLGAFKD